MSTRTISEASTRFDARLSRGQKQYFEKAALLGGYRSLTDFFVSTAMEKAKEIISESEQIIASQRDSDIFFNALLAQAQPNNSLIKAASEYKHRLSTE